MVGSVYNSFPKSRKYSLFRLHGSSADRWDSYQARNWSALAVVGNAGKSCIEVVDTDASCSSTRSVLEELFYLF